MIQAQSILPSLNDEYCPETEITFTVTVPGTYQSINGINGNYVTVSPYNFSSSGGNTTFDFKGKFADVNKAQTFRVNHSTGTYDAIFTRVKSLFYTISCSQVQLNQTTIIAPPCQVTNHTISFNNVQWGTAFESPQLCFGSITTYEYLLPNGWSMNSTTSNGSTWIAGDNSETVTSDLSTGGVIRVRPSNSCGASFAKNQAEGIINISRPKPPLTFTGGHAVCTTQDFQALSVPAWVTNYNWQVTPTTIFGNANPTSNPTTVTKLFDGEGDIQLTISGSSCPLTFTYNTQEITGQPKLIAGKPVVLSTLPIMIYNGPGDENEVCRDVETIIEFSNGSSTTNWSYVSHSGGPQPSWSGLYPDDLYVYFFKPTQNTLVLKMDVTNFCGTTSYDFGFKAVDCGVLAANSEINSFKVSPNPASSTINISPNEVTSEKPASKLITEVVISDFNNQIIKRKKVDKMASTQVFIGDIKPGAYYVTIKSGNYTETQKIFKQ